MEISLYPYNYYFLYFSVGLLIAFLIMTVVKLLSLPKAAASLTPALDKMKKQTDLISIKTGAMNETKKESEKYTKLAAKAVPIVLAVWTIYKNNDNYHGLNGYVSAAKAYIKNDQAERKIIQRIKKAL